MPRAKKPTPATTPFVIYVRFPSGGKEYAYLCADPTIRQGSFVIANGTSVMVLRTASHDPLATRFVGADIDSKRRHIATRLNELMRQEEFITRASKLKSAEGRRLVRELKELSK